jgi:hypothetical protein
MPTEQEELRLTVTLADNASAGLGKLQDQIKELSGGGGAGGNKHIEKLNEGTKALTETVMKMTGSFGEAFKSLGMLRLGFIGGVAGLSAFGYEMAKQMKDLGEYTDKIRNLGQLGKDIGVNPAVIKNISEQLKVFGVATEQSEAALTRFAQRMSELQRDPRVRQNILEHWTANTPQAQAAMKGLLDTLQSKSADLYDKLNAVNKAYELIRQNALRRGETEERAADEARQGVAELGYSPELARAGVLKKLSDEEKAAWAAKQAAADHYSETLGKIEGHWDNIIEKMKESATSKDSWLTKSAESFERLSDHLDKGVAGASSYPGGVRQFYKDLKEQAERSKPHDFEGRWPGANEQFGPLQIPRVQKQSYRGIGIDGNPLLQQAAFVSEEHKKGIEQNTEQLKRLNDLLMQAMGLSGSAAGGGFQNASFTTGGGFGGGGGLGGTTPRGFGGGGYRDLGTTYGSGGGGGDAGVDRGAAGTPRMSQSRRDVARVAAGALRAGGMSEKMIAGIFANISDESAFNPNLRHPDQPRYGGEAHFAHGLYQEGGAEWNNYAAWIAKNHPDGNWRDPKLQSEFLAYRMKTGYPRTWQKMMNARSPGEAAATFVNEYLKPAAGYRASRMSKYLRGVPGVEAYTGKEDAAQVPSSPPTAADQPPRATLTPEALRAYGERRLMHQSGDLTRENLLAHARRSLDADQNGATKVEGNAKIRVDVNAPKGTNVGAEASGLFSTIETYRQTQMDPAQRGPPRW